MTSADGRINPRLTHRETQRGRLGSTSQQSSSPTNSSRHRDIFRRLVESVAETDRNLSGLLELAIRQDDEDKQEVDGEVDGTEEVEAAWPPRSTDRADQLIYASSAQASLRNAVSERDDESGRRRVRSLRNLPNDITLTELESELPRNSQYSDCPLTSSQPLNSEQSAESSSVAPSSNLSSSAVSSRKIILDELNDPKLAPDATSSSYDPALPKIVTISGFPRGFLYCGSKFQGTQSSKSRHFEVEMTVEAVDFQTCQIFGSLYTKAYNPRGMTTDLREQTTFFVGEIISEHFPFVTSKWDTDIEVDLSHWSKFSDFHEKFGTNFSSRNFDSSRLLNDTMLYMRWKETPVDTSNPIPSGFYCVSLDETTGIITGFYFHRRSETHELLSLRHVDQFVYEGYEVR